MPRCMIVLAVLLFAGHPMVAAAAPLRFQCDSYQWRSGEHSRRLTTIDLDQGTVVDGKPTRYRPVMEVWPVNLAKRVPIMFHSCPTLIGMGQHGGRGLQRRLWI